MAEEEVWDATKAMLRAYQHVRRLHAIATEPESHSAATKFEVAIAAQRWLDETGEQLKRMGYDDVVDAAAGRAEEENRGR